MDLPGMDYSWSTWSTAAACDDPRRCSLAASIDAVEWLVSQLAPEGTGRQVDLLGHSYGANIALEVARRSEASGHTSVRHVHLLAPGGASAARLTRPTLGGSGHVQTTRKRSRLASCVASCVASLAEALVMPIVLGIFASPNTLNLFYEPSYVEYVRRRHAIEPLASPPAHLIFGSWDDLIMPRPMKGLRATFPKAEMVVVRRALHQLNVLHPATVCACIEAFEERQGCRISRLPAQGIRDKALCLLRCGLAGLDRLLGVVAEPMT